MIDLHIVKPGLIACTVCGNPSTNKNIGPGVNPEQSTFCALLKKTVLWKDIIKLLVYANFMSLRLLIAVIIKVLLFNDWRPSKVAYKLYNLCQTL